MKQIDDKTLKDIEIEGLKYIKKVCEENNLDYYIAFGALIGTIRHEGFIPWDDDIDIVMKRKDYEKFIKIVESSNNEDWEILTYKNKGYYFPWAKLCHKKSLILPSRFFTGLTYGISVDIFPLESFNAENEEEALKKAKEVNTSLVKLLKKIKPLTGGICKNKFKQFLKKNYFKFSRVFFDKHVSFYDQIKEKSLSCENGNFYMCVCALGYCVIKAEELSSKIDKKFEGEYFTVPVGYDSILRRQYGDYMQLPPVEQRVTNHSFIAYFKEEEKK